MVKNIRQKKRIGIDKMELTLCLVLDEILYDGSCRLDWVHLCFFFSNGCSDVGARLGWMDVTL